MMSEEDVKNHHKMIKELEQKEKSEGKVYDDHSFHRTPLETKQDKNNGN